MIDDEMHDRRMLNEISRITNDYGALHRRTARDLARSRAELSKAHSVLGTVAHDLRTPLSSVLGFTDLLLEDEELAPSQRALAERVRRAAGTMAMLTDELVEAVVVGESPLRSDPVNLSRVARQVVTRHQLLQSPRGVRTVLDDERTQGRPTTVQGDQAKLERLLDNLVSNAMKFSPDDGEVHVRVGDDGREAEIRVRDDGPGLPAEQLESIFAPFHRAPGAAAVPGVGLGLTIVKQVAERHGGRVHVESVLGSGATFVVRLPLATS